MLCVLQGGMLMANGTGVSNYVFPEDKQAAEEALTQRLYEYALQQEPSSLLGTLGTGINESNLNFYAQKIQRGDKDYKKAQEDYLKEGQKWLSRERRALSNEALLQRIRENPVFRRRLITLENPETFADPFWNGL